MPYLIVTDPINTYSYVKKNEWGKGSRLYYCGEGPTMPNLAFAISNATEFGTTEAAELRLMVLQIWEPDLIEHGHIVEREAAWAQWHEDLKDFEKRSGIEEDPLGHEQTGCF